MAINDSDLLYSYNNLLVSTHPDLLYDCLLASIVLLIIVISQEQVFVAFALVLFKVKIVYVRDQPELQSSRFVCERISVCTTWDFP